MAISAAKDSLFIDWLRAGGSAARYIGRAAMVLLLCGRRAAIPSTHWSRRCPNTEDNNTAIYAQSYADRTSENISSIAFTGCAPLKVTGLFPEPASAMIKYGTPPIF